MSIVRISERAMAYISELCAGGEKLLMVKVNNKGCSGHSYEYSLVDQSILGRLDEVISWDGGALVISGPSVMHLIGSHLDLISDHMQSQLVWSNPQAVNMCGCGESFSLSS